MSLYQRDQAMKYFHQACALVNNAVAMDKAGNYKEAVKFYTQACAKFKLVVCLPEAGQIYVTKAQNSIQSCEARIDELTNLPQNDPKPNKRDVKPLPKKKVDDVPHVAAKDQYLKDFNEGNSLVRSAISSEKSGNVYDAIKFYAEACSKYKSVVNQKDVPKKYAEKTVEYIKRCEDRIKELSISLTEQNPRAKPGNKRKELTEEEEIEQVLEELLNDSSLEEKGVNGFDEIYGHEEAKNKLKEAVISPLKLKHLFTGERSPTHNILLYGPLGTGKSSLAKAVAAEAGAELFNVSVNDIISKEQEEAANIIEATFKMARMLQPAVIFINDIENLLPETVTTEQELMHRINQEFIAQLRDLEKVKNDVFVIAASSKPWELDLKVRRKFQVRIYVKLPDFETRKAIIREGLKNYPNNITERQIDQIAEITENHLYCEITSLISISASQPLARAESAEFFREKGGMLYPCNASDKGAKKMSLYDADFPHDKLFTLLSMTDFREAIRHVTPCFSEADIDQYNKWDDDFGPGVSALKINLN